MGVAMTKKKHQLRRKIANALVSVFVLGIVMAPSLLTARWALGVVNSQDPRKVTKIEPMQTRAIDKTSAPLQPFNEPLISVSFDDGRESVYTKALPVLQKDGIHTTQYIISGELTDRSYLSIGQIKAMQANGHEVASHTVTNPDLTTLTDTEINKELVDSKDTLSQDFGPIKDFTSPYGAYNAHTLQLIGKYYRSQKNAEGDPAVNELEAINTKANFKPLDIQSYSVRSTTSMDDLKKLIKAARDNNGWLVLTYHQVDYSNTLYSVSPEVFAQQMQLIDQSNMRTPTIGQVLNSLTLTQGAKN
jgi:peptidoglycan/xylan/chitin deacetylase (PgdA/CDA1 family)